MRVDTRLPLAMFGLFAAFASASAAIDGIPDISFDGDGTALLTVHGGGKADSAIGDGSGGLVVAGVLTAAPNPEKLVMAHLLPDGSPDASYGNIPGEPGRSMFDLSTAPYGSSIAALAPAPNGGTYVAANYNFYQYAYYSRVYRIAADGRADAAWPDGYSNVVPSNGLQSTYINAIGAMPDGGFVVLNRDFPSVGVTGTPRNVLRRYSANGNRDGSFGGGTGELAFDTTDVYPFDAVVGADGHIYLAGLRNSRSVIFRVNAAGIVDTTFANGATYASLGSATPLGIRLALQADGRIVAAENTGSSANYECHLFRLLSNGNPDLTFGNQSVTTVSTPATSNLSCNRVLVQEAKRLVVGAQAGTSPFTQYALAYTQRRGVIDVGFGTANGIEQTMGYVVALDAKQRALLVGPSTTALQVGRLTADSLFASDFELELP